MIARPKWTRIGSTDIALPPLGRLLRAVGTGIDASGLFRGDGTENGGLLPKSSTGKHLPTNDLVRFAYAETATEQAKRTKSFVGKC
ncbi:hypothetical protein, partial [Mesorhizobium sp. M4A.F.Ca.ET.090.04.2.1]|uniref:hypothetical protein n=1 Tax=Mesorhizobium sp. M4A.F.Ca.ET.090.04.2.1 TaxID=2496663 RepID=UPI001AECD931